MSHRRQRGSQHNETTARDAGCALRGQQQHCQQGQLLRQRHRRVGRLRDEHGRHRQVDRGAIQVERIARGDHQADHRLAGAQVLHLLHHARQHRFRRRGAQHHQQLFLDVANELDDAEAMQAADDAQHDKDEEQTSQVERTHQLAQREQRADAVLADGEGHRTEGADGGDLHDDSDDVEQHMREFLDEVEHHRAAAAELVQRKAEQHREQQHLQDLTLGKGVHHRGGDHMQQEVHGALHLAGLGVGRNALGVQRVGVHVHARAGLQHIDHDQADDQGQGRDDLEVQQGQAAGLAHLLHVFHAGDAHHHGTEDDGRDDHLDQFDEAVAQGFHLGAHFRREVAQHHADDDGEQHLNVERFVERLACRCLRHGAGLCGVRVRTQRRPARSSRPICPGGDVARTIPSPVWAANCGVQQAG